MVSTDRYATHIQAIKNHCGAAFLMLRQDHVRFLNGNCSAAVVLAYILNRLRMKDASNSDRERLMKDNLWFQCPAKDIQVDLKVGEDRQRTAIAALTEAGLLETERRKGNILWVRVLDEGLNSIDQVPVQKRGNPGTRNGETPELETGKPRNPTIRDNNPSNNCSPATGNRVCRFNLNGVINNGHPPHEKLAARLLRTLRKHGKLCRQPDETTVKKWGKQFVSLLTLHPAAEVEKVIDGYGRIIHERFAPMGYSATSFCEKYTSIKAALNRLGDEAVPTADEIDPTVKLRESLSSGKLSIDIRDLGN